jgi:hypothetical protein
MRGLAYADLPMKRESVFQGSRPVTGERENN